MLRPDQPALVLAPMEGVTDAPMRAVQGEISSFTYAVSEFLRIHHIVPTRAVFLRHIPELATGMTTRSGLPVQIQLLGGDPELMADSATFACELGARSIDLNFGCPARTVNRHDGGATLLKHPTRLRAIVAAVRAAVPAQIPVSAKLRLGWDNVDAIFENAAMAAEGGATWLTIHARTREAGYAPPVDWPQVGRVRQQLGIPVIANGDIWTIDDFRRCRDATGCIHYMLGRGALANPGLSAEVARELGLPDSARRPAVDWPERLLRLVEKSRPFVQIRPEQTLCKLKQWLSLAAKFGRFSGFDRIKRAGSLEELLAQLSQIKESAGLLGSSPRAADFDLADARACLLAEIQSD